MHGKNAINTFQLQDYGLFHQYIQPITAIEQYTFVGDGKGDLPLELEAPQLHLATQAFFVS